MPARRIVASCAAQKASDRRRLTKPGPATCDGRDVRIGLKPHGNLHGKLARLSSERLCEHHRGIGRDVAMRGVARRLGIDAVERAGARPRRRGADDRSPPRRGSAARNLEEVHRNPAPDNAAQADRAASAASARALAQIGGVVKQPLMLGDRIAVGHAGNVIRDARATVQNASAGSRPLPPFVRHCATDRRVTPRRGRRPAPRPAVTGRMTALVAIDACR